MKRKYLICVNHVCPSCSLLLWVTGSLGAPANITFISDNHVFVAGLLSRHGMLYSYNNPSNSRILIGCRL